jgi:hypothetical protein
MPGSNSREQNHEDLDGSLNILVHLGPHETEQDFELCAPDLLSTDVFIPEFLYITDSQQKQFNRVARGSYKDLERLQNSLNHEFASGVLKTIYFQSRQRKGHGKKVLDIALLDLPPIRSWMEVGERIRFLDNHVPIHATLDSTLEASSHNLLEYASLQKKREDVIARNIDQYLRKKILATPTLPLDAYIVIGYLHGGLVNKLRDSGRRVSIDEKSFLDEDGHKGSAQRKALRGEVPSRQLLLRALIGSVLGTKTQDKRKRVDSPFTRVYIKAIGQIVELASEKYDLEALGEHAVEIVSKKKGIGLDQVAGEIMTETVGKPFVCHGEAVELAKQLNLPTENK